MPLLAEPPFRAPALTPAGTWTGHWARWLASIADLFRNNSIPQSTVQVVALTVTGPTLITAANSQPADGDILTVVLQVQLQGAQIAWDPETFLWAPVDIAADVGTQSVFDFKALKGLYVMSGLPSIGQPVQS